MCNGLQLIMLAFSIAIVALMQPIVTRASFAHLPQSLTSLSDKVSTWSGLGSSLVNLYHNLGFRATLGNAILTSIYFSTLSGLGISSSFLFIVPAVNEMVTSRLTTTLGAPPISASIPTGPGAQSVPDNFTHITIDWYRSGVGVGMLTGNTTALYPGLSSNRLYDTLSPPMSSSNATAVVGYTDFNVKCGSVPQFSISATSPTGSSIENFVSDDGASGTTLDAAMRVLLSINYTLGSTQTTMSDGLSISSQNTSFAIERLWTPAGMHNWYLGTYISFLTGMQRSWCAFRV